MMNEDIQLNKHAQIPFHPLVKMLSYLQFGILLISFQIDIGLIKYVTIIIGLILIYLGLRIVREANAYFQIAYLLSIASLIIEVLYLAVLATPYYWKASYIASFSMALWYIMVFIIYTALKKYSHDQASLKQLIYAYCIMQISGGLGYILGGVWEVIGIILFITCFGILMIALSAIKKDVMAHQYLLKLSSVKVNGWFIGFIYVLVVWLAIGSAFFMTTSCAGRSIENGYSYTEYNYQEIAHQKIIEKENLKLKINYTIINDKSRGCYLHVIDYEWLKFPAYTYKTQLTLYRNPEKSYELPQQSFQNIVYNDVMNYQSTQQEEMVEGLMSNTPVIISNTYVNPWNHQIKGQITYAVGYQFKDKIIEYPLVFGLKNDITFPYQENTNQQIEIFVLIKNQEIENWIYE